MTSPKKVNLKQKKQLEENESSTPKHLGNLSPKAGSVKTKKRLGRGVGSGLGKTSGKGHKGMRARKSGGTPPGFEGGQTPLYRRLPKRGFDNPFRTHFAAVNLSSLEERFEAGATIDTKALIEKGLVPKNTKKAKILGSEGLSKSLNFIVDKASKAAEQAITKAGGKIEYVKGPTKFLRPSKKGVRS